MIEKFSFFFNEVQKETSRQLMLLTIISQGFVQPFSMEDNLLVLLTALTSGSGVGFNRAMLFLKDGDALRGDMWLGPKSAWEAQNIWNMLSIPGMGFVEVIEYNRSLVNKSQDNLSQRIRNLRYPLNGKELLIPALPARDKDILLVKDARNEPLVDPKFLGVIDVDDFVCIPLLTRNEVFGEIILDNAFTKAPIASMDVKLAVICALIAGNYIYTAAQHKKLIDTEKMAVLGEMAAFVAHQIRNPLVTIGGFTEQLLQPGLDEEKKQRNLEIIRQETVRLEDVVYKIGHFLKITIKPPVVFDVRPVLISGIESPDIKSLAQSRDVRLNIRISKNPPQVLCDPTYVGEVLRNVLENAIEASPRGGKVSVLAYVKDEKTFVLSIKDSGGGISETNKAKLFSPFFHDQREGDGPRTGLRQEGYGLLRRQNRGQEPGRQRDPVPLIIPMSMPGKEDLLMKKILLVEDEHSLCLLYEEELTAEGYQVTCVHDADSALDALKKEAFDLIITDIRMPGKDGVELIAQIMGLRKDIPIIINTAYQSYKEDFMTWAADAYVVKSSSLAELKAKVRELIKD